MITNLLQWKAWAKTFPARADASKPYVSPFRVVNKTPASAEILIYEEIGRDFWSGEGMAAKDFSELLKGIEPNATLTVGINSPGGNCWDGLAITNQIEAWRGHTITRNDGMAASIASVILQAGKERQTHQSAMVMIHRAWGLMIGNADDAAQFQKDLEKHDQVISELYARRSGKPEQGFKDAMAAETIYTGQEAMEAGLVDTVLNPVAHNNLAANAVEPGVQMSAAGNNTHRKNKNMDTNTSAPAATIPPAPVIENTELATLQARVIDITAQLARERKDRIQRAVHALVISNQLTAPEVAAATARCLADESYLGELAARPAALPGIAPLNSFAEVSATGPMGEINKRKKGRERFDFMRDNWQDLNASMPRSPRGANTVDSALVTQMLLEGTTTVLQNRLAPLRAFSREVAIDRIKPLAVLQHRKVTGGGTAQTNATNFEDTTNFIGANDNVQITVAQITSGGHATNAEKQSGHALAFWTEVKVGELSDAVMAAVAAKILTSTYTATPTVSAAAAFGMSELKILYGQLKKATTKNLVLDGEYYAQFLPSTLIDFNVLNVGMPGWDVVAMNTVWTGATANTVGFACHPQALVCGVGLPLRDPEANNVSTENVLQLPELGIAVAVTNWYSNITRASWTTWDIMFGAAANDTTAAVIIKSA